MFEGLPNINLRKDAARAHLDSAYGVLCGRTTHVSGDSTLMLVRLRPARLKLFMAAFTELLGPELLGPSSNSVSTALALGGKSAVALYFSAHWCPPCRSGVQKTIPYHLTCMVLPETLRNFKPAIAWNMGGLWEKGTGFILVQHALERSSTRQRSATCPFARNFKSLDLWASSGADA
eukprot:4034534-Amphidinium_carterae.2